MNGVTFERRGELIWVAPQYEDKLTPEIEEAIRRNQSTVSAFVVSIPKTEVPKPVVSEQPIDPDSLPDEEWDEDSKAFFADLLAMESGQKR